MGKDYARLLREERGAIVARECTSKGSKVWWLWQEMTLEQRIRFCRKKWALRSSAAGMDRPGWRWVGLCKAVWSLVALVDRQTEAGFPRSGRLERVRLTKTGSGAVAELRNARTPAPAGI
jgi:hypothetical protein